MLHVYSSMSLRRINSVYGIVYRFIIKTTKLSFTGAFRNLFCYSSGRRLRPLSPRLLLPSGRPSILMKQIRRCLTTIIFTRSLNRIDALYYFSLLRSKNILPSRPRGPFNLYGTQFRSSTEGVISFGLMAKKKFQRGREAGSAGSARALFYRIIRGNADYSFPN